MRFNSESEKTVWIINNLPAKESIKLLGVTKRHYKSKDEAKAWRNKWMKLVHPDNARIPGSQQAAAFIQYLYEDMIR